MRKCDFPGCKEETDYLIPFKCNYCGGYFCPDHKLPSMHFCPNIVAWKSKSPPTRATPAKYSIKHLSRPSEKPFYKFDRRPTFKKSRTKKKKRTIAKAILVTFILLSATSIIYTRPEIVSSLHNVLDEYITTLEESWVEFITPPLEKPGEVQRAEKLIATNINELRAFNSLHELTWNEKLAQVARLHSQDMAERGYFSHDTPEGVDIVDRVTAQGYDYFALGENIYMISGDSRMSPEELATLCVEGWYDSYGHRQIMLSVDYQEIGVGVYLKGDDIYVTADFGAT